MGTQGFKGVRGLVFGAELESIGVGVFGWSII